VCYGLSRRELPFKRLVPVAVTDKGIKLAPVVKKMDMRFEGLVVLKTVLPWVHAAPLLSYFRISGKPGWRLIHCNSQASNSVLKRMVNNFSETSASRRPGVEESPQHAPALS